MSTQIKPLTDASFEADVLHSPKPVLVFYWSEWCGPCKTMASIIAEVAQEYGDKVQFAKLDVDENQDTPNRYGVQGAPTLMLFKNGAVVAQEVGALSKSRLVAFLDANT